MATSIRLDGLLAKEETTPGVDAAPTPAQDGVRIVQRLHPQLAFEYAFLNRRDEAASGSLLVAAPAARFGRLATVDIAVDLNGAGEPYSTSVLPPADPLLVACGLTRTVDESAGSETVTYVRADTDHASATLWCYAAGNVIKLVGCRGNLVWPITAGGFGQARFVMQGVIEEDPATAALPAITYVSELPPAAANMTFSFGGWVPDLVSAEFDLQADVQRIDSAAALEAVAEFAIAGFDPRFTLSAPTVDLATFNPYTVSKAATALALNQVLGSDQYNTVALTSSEVYVETPSNQDLNGFTQWSIESQVRNFDLIFS